MRARDFELRLPELTGHTSTDIDLRFRELRKLRMLPVGGRGRNAPEIEPEHAATILIGTAGSSKASEAARAVLDFAPLREYTIGGETFAEALTAILEDEPLARCVRSVRLCRTLVYAEIEYEDGSKTRRFFSEDTLSQIASIGEQRVLGFGQGRIVDQTVIGGGVIHQLSIELGEEDDTGELVDES